MTDFNMHVDVDYTIDSDYHKNGRVEIQITLDEKSAESFYHWLADGCDNDLILNKNGCRLEDPRKVNLYNQVRNDLDFAIHYADGIPWSSKEYRDAEQDPKYNELCYWDDHTYPEPARAKEEQKIAESEMKENES